MPPVWKKRFERLFWLGLVSLFGLAIFVPLFFVGGTPPLWLALIGMLLVLPFGVYLTVVTMWHWKARYRGKNSDLWGVLIVLETTSWFKLVYLFRHIVPDARGKGRYAIPGDIQQ